MDVELTGMESVLVVVDDVVVAKQGYSRKGGCLCAYSAVDGKKLWERSAQEGFHSAMDVLCIDGLVWVGPHFIEAYDLHTGELKKKLIPTERLRTIGHHHRCYRNKATPNYIYASWRGVEVYDLKGSNHSRNNWIRGTCQLGNLPANGLLYTTPHSCACYMEAMLFGLYAFAPERISSQQ